MRFASLARKLDTGPALAPPQQPRVFALEAPPPTAFLVGHKPFMVVDDEQGVAFGLVDLKRVDGEVVIDTFTYISPPDADVTDRFPPPARFRKYRLQRPGVVFLDRNDRVEARIELRPWRGRDARAARHRRGCSVCHEPRHLGSPAPIEDEFTCLLRARAT